MVISGSNEKPYGLVVSIIGYGSGSYFSLEFSCETIYKYTTLEDWDSECK
jgi:hypothetical protein